MGTNKKNDRRNLELKNPFIFAPIKLGYSDEKGYTNERHSAFYNARSRYLGAVTVEPLYLDKGLREIPTQLGIDEDNKIQGLIGLTESIHKFDTKAIAHLSHPGRMANPNIPDNYLISSTDKSCENVDSAPKRMDSGDLEKTITLFTSAAKRAQEAQFDFIELQFGHGYLLAQFLSPRVNDRTDEYGGTFENRIKFPTKVLKAVMETVNLPIIARISGDEMIPDGIKLHEMIKFSNLLKEKGVAAIHVSAGTVCSSPPWFFQHMFVPKGETWKMASELKETVNIPVIAVGKINTVEDIKKVKKDHSADYLAIGRALIADPNFVGKYLGKENEPIVPCLACVEGCLGGVKSGQGLQCLVNPEVGQEKEDFQPASEAKEYAVVGGGLAGMKAALTLRRRGHSVDLYEKNKLGGQFNFAPLTPNKQSMSRLVPYFVEELQNKGVNTIFKKATKTDLISGYDGVVLATGSKPSVPDIPGLDEFYWADILLEENLPENKRILIIGGGLIGVDIATALIPKGNTLIIVKRTTNFGENMEVIAKTLSLKTMKENETIFSDHTNIKKIEGDTVFAEKNGDQITFDNIDIIVVSTGMRNYNPLEDKLTNEMPVHIVGDAKQVGNAQDAIKDAYETTKKL